MSKKLLAKRTQPAQVWENNFYVSSISKFLVKVELHILVSQLLTVFILNDKQATFNVFTLLILDNYYQEMTGDFAMKS